MYSGTMWAGAGKLFSMGANFIVTLVLARVLTPAEYGMFFVALTTIVIVASVGTLGMDQIVVRFAAMHAGKYDYTSARRVIVRCFSIVVAGTLVSCTGFFWFGPAFFQSALNMPTLAAYIGVLVVWLLFATLQRQLAETFRGLNDIRLATLFGGVRSSGIINAALTCFIILILWVGKQLTLFTAWLAMLGSSILVVLIATFVMWRYLRRHEQVQGAGGAYHLTTTTALREGWPLWLAMLVTVLSNVGGSWLAAGLDTSAHVALYGVAQRFVLLLVAPMVVINAVLPPVISQLHVSMQLKQMERIVRSVSGLLLIPTIALLAVLVVGGKPMLSLLFGAFYENAYLILVVLCLGQVVNIATGAWQVVLPMTGARHQMLASSMIAVITQLVLGLALGYRFGVLGVAIGFCASTVITNIVGMFFVHHKLGIWTYAAWSRCTMKGAVEMIATRILRRVVWSKP